jgi:outer membrane protein assembly factor BamB
MSQDLKDSPLPEGWTEQKADNGKTYYFHAKTGKSSWKRPVPETTAANTKELEKKSFFAPIQTNVAEASSPAPASLPEGWTEQKSDNGKTYYFHQKTGKSSWKRPTDVSLQVCDYST